MTDFDYRLTLKRKLSPKEVPSFEIWNGWYHSVQHKSSGIAYVFVISYVISILFSKDAHVWCCQFAEYVAKMTRH